MENTRHVPIPNVPVPRFSIITVTHNNLPGLCRTRDSICVQTFRNFEWIVMDGASIDGTPEALQRWQPEIQASISAADNGPYDAMNKGLALAHGEYVLFINAGDALAAPDVLHQLHDALGQHPSDFAYGDSVEEQPGGTEFYKPARHHAYRWWGMFASHQSMIYRTCFLREMLPAYDLRYRVGADMDLVWRVLRKTKSVLRIRFSVARTARAGISAAHAARARREQLMMRHEHSRMPALLNVLIMMGQQCTWTLRQMLPDFYAFYRLRNNAVSS